MPTAPAAHLPAGEAAWPVAPWDVGRGAWEGPTGSSGQRQQSLHSVAAELFPWEFVRRLIAGPVFFVKYSPVVSLAFELSQKTSKYFCLVTQN